jgi:hypothetical protein
MSRSFEALVVLDEPNVHQGSLFIGTAGGTFSCASTGRTECSPRKSAVPPTLLLMVGVTSVVVSRNWLWDLLNLGGGAAAIASIFGWMNLLLAVLEVYVR